MIIDTENNPTFFDAIYMMVITISTVGYGEVWSLSPPAKLWTIGVITFGIVTASYAFTSLLRLVVSGELRSLREREKMEKAIKHLDGHVIICGYGRMGAFVTRELRKLDVPLVIVEQERAFEEDLHDADVPYVVGDATEEETLLRAGLGRAKALVGPDPDAHLEAKDTLILVGPAGVSTRLDEIEAGD